MVCTIWILSPRHKVNSQKLITLFGQMTLQQEFGFGISG
jgi:hypothetical protein